MSSDSDGPWELALWLLFSFSGTRELMPLFCCAFMKALVPYGKTSKYNTIGRRKRKNTEAAFVFGDSLGADAGWLRTGIAAEMVKLRCNTGALRRTTDKIRRTEEAQGPATHSKVKQIHFTGVKPFPFNHEHFNRGNYSKSRFIAAYHTACYIPLSADQMFIEIEKLHFYTSKPVIHPQISLQDLSCNTFKRTLVVQATAFVIAKRGALLATTMRLG